MTRHSALVESTTNYESSASITPPIDTILDIFNSIMNGLYFNNTMTIKTRRRRVQTHHGTHIHHQHRDNTARSVMASFLLSLSAAVAFQSALFPTGRRVAHRQCLTPSRLAVLKDPDMLVKDDLFVRRDGFVVVGKQQQQQQQQRKDKSLKSLEDAFSSSPNFEDANVNHHNNNPRSNRATPIRSKPSSSFVDRPKQQQHQQSQPILSVRQRKRSSPVPSTLSTSASATTMMTMADGSPLGNFPFNNYNNEMVDDVVTDFIPAVPLPPPPSSTTTSSSSPVNDMSSLLEPPTESSITTGNAGVQFKTTRKRRRATMKVPLAPSGTTAALSSTNNSNMASTLINKSTAGAASSSSKRPLTTGSKSSTMPGFSNRALTNKERAFEDGLRLAELRSGKNLVTAANRAEVRKSRRKLNGEAMYKNSASVPDSLVKFASEIHDEDRITHWEEKELGEKTQEALRLQNLYDHLVSTLAREPTDEEWCAAAGKINMEAITQTIQEGIDAKNKLVTANLRMVQACVNLYIRNGLGCQYNAGDMMQEGIMALIRAAEKFEPERGFRFSTYAMYWIRSAVKRSQIFQSRVITVPQRLYENHKRVLRTQRELKISMGRMPSHKELGDAVGMSAQQVERCLDAMAQRCYSLDQKVVNRLKPMNGDKQLGESTMLDLVEGKRDDGEHQKQSRTFLKEDLMETMKRYLKEEEVKLLLLRYGLVDESDEFRSDMINGPKSIAEVSDLVGLKPDKVRRMIDKSLKVLKVQIGNEWRDFERELQ